MATINEILGCGGDASRAHILVIRVSSYHEGMYDKYPCRSIESWGQYWIGTDSELANGTRWICYHECYCPDCDEILTPDGMEISQCPEYVKSYPEPVL